MSTIKSSSEHLTVTSDGTNKHTYIQDNGVTKVATTTSGIDVTGSVTAVGGISGLDQITLSSNSNNNSIKYAGVIMTNYANTTTALLGAKAESGVTEIYYGSSGVDHRGPQSHKFYTNASATATSGNTEKLRIDSSGRVTMPYQPNFSAYASSAYSIASGSGSVMQFSSTKHDNGNDFNTSTNTFTAPVSGKYYFYAHFILAGAFTTQRVIIYFHKNGVSDDALQVYRDGTDTGMGHSAVIKLAANDTITVTIFQDSGSAKDVVGGKWNGLSGYLIG